MNCKEIIRLLNRHLKLSTLLAEDPHAIPPAIHVPSFYIEKACQILYTHKKTYFDYLACITALDNGLKDNTLELIYNLYSIPYNRPLMLKVLVTREKPGEQLPEVPSVSHIWRSANWHEREVYDLMGIAFINHPDLRRILLPADWKGYPLRKDYTLQERYHGIETTY